MVIRGGLSFGSGANKKLHFHLFKFAHAENKLTCYDLVSESLTGLRNTKWNFHTRCLLHVQKIYKNALRSFGTQINGIGVFCNRTQLR